MNFNLSSFVLIFSFFIILTPPSQATPPVIIATSGDFFPANQSDAGCNQTVGTVAKTNNHHTVCGFEVDLLSEVCSLQNLNCQWTLEPFAWTEKNPEFPGILDHLLKPTTSYDLVVAYLRGSPGRLEQLSFSGTYIEGFPVVYRSSVIADHAFAVNSKGFPYSKKGQRKLRIAAAGNYIAELTNPDLAYYTKDQLESIEVVPMDSQQDQIDQMSQGKIDFAFGPNISALEFLSQGHTSFLEVPVFENSPEVGSRVFAAKTERGQYLVDQVNRGLYKLWKSGRYDEIMGRYHIRNSWGKHHGPKEPSNP